MEPLGPPTPAPLSSATPLPANGSGPQEAKLRQVAKQFEAIFVRELFKPLEKDTGEDGDELFGESNASSTWKGMLHQTMADQASGGLGIADVVFKELAAKAGIQRPRH